MARNNCIVEAEDGTKITFIDVDRALVNHGVLTIYRVNRTIIEEPMEWFWGLHKTSIKVESEEVSTTAVFAAGRWTRLYAEGSIKVG